MNKNTSFWIRLVWALAVISPMPGLAQKQSGKPNIVLILADDMGFSDLGSFGSEINTPNLDKLAQEGLRITQFYNSGRCCPSRAALLTGLYPHQAGVGDMVQDKGTPAYQGYLRKNSATIAQLLKTAGYNTIASGKWHVGLVPSAWAVNRGFDQSFTMQNNGSSYFNSEPLYNDGRTVTFQLNGREIQRYDTSRYLTQAITDFAVEAIDRVKDQQNPFFLYLAYNAPHWPIQALPEDIARYKGKYLLGWDALREARYRKLVSLGIIQKEWKLSPRYEKAPGWNTLSAAEKDKWDTRMAIYAAMIDRMDQCIGQLLDKVKAIGRERNTLVIFLSDNGGSGDTVREWNYVTQKTGEPGSVHSIDSYDPPWGNASNTPFRLFKKNTHEGGIASPFIAWFPGKIRSNALSTQVSHITDVMPTLLELAGIRYPETLANEKLTPLVGNSLTPLFQQPQATQAKTIFWEHEGSRAIRKADWKLVAEINQPWELYDLKTDRSETVNLAGRYPQKVKELEKEYLEWAAKVGVVDWNTIK
ncbi:arylsulfatase [Dyadobacter sp. BE34]|uniref:Arylsulfatase n=1 Tax=Dyadobacter fermentans TaxID=94254 RepID=A0ABU1R1R9_9BACT|nr:MULTISPECIES: arylsulfatase [Dyadobacter]MDR6807330.1 arylsulfatase [Dyadobacter fermentans]MDR7045071.1 arylsulfatase [Dyadobacter sp. BE242]MDR7199193.1 arylsulfatase [Dyadobacter sp. BE34]MDR7217153.1 arylsulfatase [Dyadobacter sp. BE31]MDR7265086.1 arylsulfatase [Dyadobacter sp. BE32]